MKMAVVSMSIRVFFFSSRRRHTRLQGDWSSDVCSSDLRPARQALHVTLRREHEDLVGEEIHLHRLEELLRILEILLPLHQLAQPGELLVEIGRASCRERV